MYIPDFGPETPGQDDLWIHLNNGIKLSDGFIQTVYIAISRQRYRLSSSNTAHVGLRDNVLAAWMRGTVDPAARPTQHYLFIRRCTCIGYPFKSISAFPLRILVYYVPRSLTCIGTARLLAWELTHIKGFGPGLQKMAFRFPGLSGRHRAPKFSQHASHILVSEAAEMAMLESVSSRSTLSRHLTWWLKSYRGDVHKVRWERTYCLTHMRVVRKGDLV